MTAGEVAVESTAGTTLERTRPRRRIRLRYLVAVALAVLLVAYGGASVLVYDKLSAVTAVCSGGRADPTSYTVPNVDVTRGSLRAGKLVVVGSGNRYGVASPRPGIRHPPGSTRRR
jgi:hypothetical protein